MLDIIFLPRNNEIFFLKNQELYQQWKNKKFNLLNFAWLLPDPQK